MPPFLILLLGSVYAAMSLVAALFMWLDKRASLRGGSKRTPEVTLHLLSMLGGWPGTLAAQRLFRHKTRKPRFVLTLWLIIALHVVGWAVLIWAVAG